MKRLRKTVIGAAFFIGGTILILGSVVVHGNGNVLGLLGIAFGILGVIILLEQLISKEE